MAALLESLLVPRASAAGRAASFSAPAAPVLGFRTSGVVQERRGLRIDTRFRKLALASSSSVARKSDVTRRGVVCEAKEAAVEVVPGVTDSSWQSLVIGCELPTLVEFWAPWCGPCRMIHPVIDELAKLYAGKLKCFKVNTDECPSIATQYGIRSIPTVIIFKNGEKKDAIIGAVPKSTLISSIEKFL